MITWEPSTSVIVAPARLAMERMTSLPAALSPLATTVQEGKVFQAGTPDGSENASSATGRWVAAITAVCSGGRAGAKALQQGVDMIANCPAGCVPCPCGDEKVMQAMARRSF